jgi:hypothetical protein
MFSRRLFLGLMLFAIPASADLLQIEVSGTFDGTAPVTTLSAPNTPWTIIFDIPSLQPDTGDFFNGTGASNFEYELNNKLVTTAKQEPAFEGGAEAAELQVYLDDGATPINFVLRSSSQLYSESATNSEILTGSFAVVAGTDTFVNIVTDAYYAPNAGPIVITDLSAVPEPGAVILLGTIVLAVVFASRVRRRRRSAALFG